MATTEQAPAAVQNGAGIPKGIPVENPATGETIATVPALSRDEVTAMVERARAAQPAWEALGFEERAKVFLRMQKWTVDNADRIIRTIVSETGKTYEDALLAEVMYCANAFGFWAKNAPEYLADEQRQVVQPDDEGQEARRPLRARRRRRRDRPVELPADELLRRLHPRARRPATPPSSSPRR